MAGLASTEVKITSETKPMPHVEGAGGLVRTSPSDSSGARDRSEGASTREAGPTVEELVAALVEKGCAVTHALVGPNIAAAPKSQARPRSADAERKARERQEKLAHGRKQLNLNAPVDPLAREFLIAAAKEIKSRKVLNALRAALNEPRLVRIGQKVLRLRGEAGDEVRRLLDL